MPCLYKTYSSITLSFLYAILRSYGLDLGGQLQLALLAGNGVIGLHRACFQIDHTIKTNLMKSAAKIHPINHAFSGAPMVVTATIIVVDMECSQVILPW